MTYTVSNNLLLSDSYTAMAYPTTTNFAGIWAISSSSTTRLMSGFGEALFAVRWRDFDEEGESLTGLYELVRSRASQASKTAIHDDVGKFGYPDANACPPS